MNENEIFVRKLMNLSTKPQFVVGTYEVISQDPFAVSTEQREAAIPAYLPQFLALWADIEKVTGHAWKCTSYIRDSPSHRKAQAFDLAPDIASHDADKYAVTHMSDPVLYKREPMIRQLQTLKRNDYSRDGSNDIGLFIEPDHIHVQVLAPSGSSFPTRVVKWKQSKPIYKDTYERMKLPMTSSSY